MNPITPSRVFLTPLRGKAPLPAVTHTLNSGFRDVVDIAEVVLSLDNEHGVAVASGHGVVRLGLPRHRERIVDSDHRDSGRHIGLRPLLTLSVSFPELARVEMVAAIPLEVVIGGMGMARGQGMSQSGLTRPWKSSAEKKCIGSH